MGSPFFLGGGRRKLNPIFVCLDNFDQLGASFQRLGSFGKVMLTMREGEGTRGVRRRRDKGASPPWVRGMRGK